MTDYKDLNIEDIGKVAGGSAPDPSELRKWPWEEVVEKIKDYVRWYKHLGYTYDKGLAMIRHYLGNTLAYPFFWGYDDADIERTFRHLWDTFESWC